MKTPKSTVATRARAWTRINSFTEGGRSVCECGHRGDGANSQHEDNTSYARGHGACKVEGCGCSRFSWDHFYADDVK